MPSNKERLEQLTIEWFNKPGTIKREANGGISFDVAYLVQDIIAANLLAPEWVSVKVATIPVEKSLLCKTSFGSRYVGYFDGDKWRLSWTSECVSDESIPTHFQELTQPKESL